MYYRLHVVNIATGALLLTTLSFIYTYAASCAYGPSLADKHSDVLVGMVMAVGMATIAN